MRATVDGLVRVFDKTNGQCHLCGRRLVLANYGAVGRRGAWERDHSRARAAGGTDTLRNLFAACVGCNRSKQVRSSRSVRRCNGLPRVPLSSVKRAQLREGDSLVGAAVGGLSAWFATRSGQAAFCAALLGALVGPELRDGA